VVQWRKVRLVLTHEALGLSRSRKLAAPIIPGRNVPNVFAHVPQFTHVVTLALATPVADAGTLATATAATTPVVHARGHGHVRGRGRGQCWCDGHGYRCGHCHRLLTKDLKN